MAQRSIALLTTLALTIIPAAQAGATGELMFGCWTRPACGKVCRLMCGTTKLTVECYGAECNEICVPGPSKQGCKHCASCCGKCTGDACGCCDQCLPCTPECKFCWFDWCPPACSQPRTVKKLKKFVAEREIPWYRWEVVDACDCGCADARDPDCVCVYKPAPPDAQIGDTLEASAEERAQAAAWRTSRLQKGTVREVAASSTTSGASPQASPSPTAADDRAAQTLPKKLTALFRLGN